MYRYWKNAWPEFGLLSVGIFTFFRIAEYAVFQAAGPTSDLIKSQPASKCFDILDGSKDEKGHCTIEGMGANLRYALGCIEAVYQDQDLPQINYS
jgi:hypothetical protein